VGNFSEKSVGALRKPKNSNAIFDSDAVLRFANAHPPLAV
jgi:hypothetical protein